MTEETVQREWHHQFAVQSFNDAWDLIDLHERTPAQEQEMLQLAMASRWHWGAIGGPEQWATGDWQISLAAALIGLPDIALRFAYSALQIAEDAGFTGWRLASAHEGAARAAACAGDQDRYAAHHAACLEALEDETDPSNRELVESQLNSISA